MDSATRQPERWTDVFRFEKRDALTPVLAVAMFWPYLESDDWQRSLVKGIGFAILMHAVGGKWRERRRETRLVKVHDAD